MDEVKIDRKLKGKTNFVSWKREFERAAKNHDILEYLTGEEIVPPKPRKGDYFEKLIENDTRRLTRSMSRGMATTQSATPPTDEGEDAYDAQAMVPANNALQWQIDYKEHKVAKSQMKLAGRLLDAWVSDGIKIEIEDYPDAKDAYDFIKKRYAVTNERARDGLLSQLNSLKLAGCSCMTEYTNRIRQIKADLKTVKYDMTDDMLATALLNGLPANFNDFKEKYDWIRSTNPDDPPDLDYLYDRLHVEEAKHSGLREERKAKDKGRRDANTSHDSTSYSGNRKPKRQDRSHLKCTYPGCGKSGHSEDTCWTKDPSKAPRSLKNRIAAGADDNPIDAIGATTETNLDTRVVSRLAEKCWIPKEKDSFRPFDNCALDISTADCSSTLEIKGGGTVRVVLRNPDGSATTVSLSEVAFAPQGKCNLFSGGLFAQKAKLTGVYNHQYMTWVDTRNQRIGHARFIDGLYHLNIEKAPGLCHSRAVVAATVNFDDPVWRWHRRLGHLGLQNMLGLLNSSTGMEITAAQIKAKLKAGKWYMSILGVRIQLKVLTEPNTFCS
ncbi:hypothetical protein MY1884_006461 [Beauveria asiatica]